MPKTSTNEPTHDERGKFLPGNKLGKGNPHVEKVAKLRNAMLTAVTQKRMTKVIQKLIEMAEGGDIKAIQLLLDRTLGKTDVAPVVAVQVNNKPDAQQCSATMQGILDKIKAESMRRKNREQLFHGGGESGQIVIEHQASEDADDSGAGG